MLIGNVGQDPEVRYLDGNSAGNKVATIRLATSERYRDRMGELREITEWHSVVVWRNLADVVEKYVKKGSQIYVEGRLRTRSWEDQNNNKHYVTEVVADNLQLLGRRPDGQSAQGGYQSSQPGYQNQNQRGGYSSGGYQQGAQPYSSRPAAPAAQAPAPAVPQTPAVEDEDDDLPF